MSNISPEVMKQKIMGGIDKYHAMGYIGNCNVMQIESGTSPHADGVVDDVLDIAPGDTVYRTGSTIRTSNYAVLQADCYYNGITYTIEEFIKQFKIKIVTASFGGSVVSEALRKYWQNLIDKYNIILISSAGNEGTDGVTMFAPDSVCWAIGAVGITDSGTIVPKSYSGVGNEVDFAYFTGDQEGTSFACPRIDGVVSLLIHRFGDRTKSQMYEMLKVLSKDVYTLGVDNKTGWGVPILHEDDNVRLGKLAEQIVTGTLREIDIKKMPDGVKKRVKAILYGNENWVRLRDNEDILGLIDVEYDSVEKIPVVTD